jgi:hypothetical protein
LKRAQRAASFAPDLEPHAIADRTHGSMSPVTISCMATEPFRVDSPGDLEIAILHEAHSLMADIITPRLYKVVGIPSEQMIHFATGAAFELFAIRVAELVSESRGNVKIPGVPANVSLVSGLTWVADRLSEPGTASLRAQLRTLTAWLEERDPCRFWCAGLGVEMTFYVPRIQLWNVFGNNLKHTFLRLQRVTKQLHRWSADAGLIVDGSDVLHVLDAFGEWLRGYCEYHASMVAELIGRVFDALNNIIWQRWQANGATNKSSQIVHPPGASSYFQDLHGSLLVFRRYDETRITALIPETSPNLRQIYNP